MKNLITTIFISISIFTFGQTNISKLKSYKNVVTFNNCNHINSDNKNEVIQCIDNNFETFSNNYFKKINTIKFDSIKPTKENIVNAYFDIVYSNNGQLKDIRLLNINSLNNDISKDIINKINPLIKPFFNEFFLILNGVEKPAKNFNNEDVESELPFNITIKLYNDELLFQYQNIPTILDFNDYSNQLEINEYYAIIYKNLESKISSGFSEIAKKNNISKSVAHLKFEISSTGEITNIDAKTENSDDVILGDFIISLFKNEIQKNNKIVISKLKDGKPTNKKYMMSFQFGYR